jgi:hypothetical protein
MIKRVPDDCFGGVNMSSNIDRKLLEYEVKKLDPFSIRNLESKFPKFCKFFKFSNFFRAQIARTQFGRPANLP